MVESKYLYDTDIKQYASLPYSMVLVIKVYLANKLMKKLVIDQDMRDNQRMSAVFKAIQFNRDLLKETGFDDKNISMSLKKVAEDFKSQS